MPQHPFVSRIAMGGVAALAAFQLFAAPAAAGPRTTPIATMDSGAVHESLVREATDLESGGRWLGAVATWRELARTTDADAADHQMALQRLHELSGLSWMAPIKSKVAMPILVGQDVVAVPYQVKYGSGMRNVVTAVRRDNGQIAWTRNDAVAFPMGSDVAVFVQNWRQVSRVDLKTGADMWVHAFPPPRRDAPDNSPNRKVLGIDATSAYVLGDSWPMALDLQTGKPRWGPHTGAMGGYCAAITRAGILAWPGQPDAAGRSAPMVMLSKVNGEILWRHDILPGEPWQVTFDDSHVYLADHRLASEKAWTAVDLDSGDTIWRQAQDAERPSTITPVSGVLVEQSTTGSDLTRFLDPATGRCLWQTDRMVKYFADGPVLEGGEGGPVTARDLHTGGVWWNLRNHEDLRLDPTTALLDGKLYFSAFGIGSMSGTSVPGALAADARTGDVSWRNRAQDTPYQEDMQTLGVAGDLLLMDRTMRIARPKLAGPGHQGAVDSLLAFDTQQGKLAWAFWDLAPLHAAPPVRVGDTLYVVGADRDGQTVYSFDLAKIRALVAEGRRWWW